MRSSDSFLKRSWAEYARIETVGLSAFKHSLLPMRWLTDTRDRGAKMGQYWGTGVAHLAFNRQLSLNIHLASPSPDEEGCDTGEGKDRREDNDGPELDQHRQTDLQQGG